MKKNCFILILAICSMNMASAVHQFYAQGQHFKHLMGTGFLTGFIANVVPHRSTSQWGLGNLMSSIVMGWRCYTHAQQLEKHCYPELNNWRLTWPQHNEKFYLFPSDILLSAGVCYGIGMTCGYGLKTVVPFVLAKAYGLRSGIRG